MLETVLRLLPVLVGMAAGLVLRRAGMADHRDGETVFKLVFYIFLPAAMFVSLSTVRLDPSFARYPLAAAAIIAVGFLAGWLTAARTRVAPVQAAVMVSACMIVNAGFALPFVQVLYGAEGVARIAAFDAVNATVTFTLAYYVAVRANPRHQGGSLMLGRLARTPALYAIVAGLAVNLAGLHVPTSIAGPAAAFGAATAVLIPVGIGILFDPLGGGLRLAGVVVAVRFVTGVLVAGAIVLLGGLTGMDRTILLLLGVAPLAFSTVTFASLENLDVRLATSGLSLSLLASLALSLLIVLAAG